MSFPFRLPLSGLLRLGVAAIAFAACSAMAASKEPLLEADRISYDEEAGIITASGRVELSSGAQMLRADKITLNKKTNVVRAYGDIQMTQGSGEVLHAKSLEVTSDLKEGFMEAIGVYFPDRSRMAAARAQRYEGRYLIAEKGVYSSCALCAQDPMNPPLWQIKGERITHDAQEKQIIYRDATIEFEGVPVFYTPYFSHPDPTVKRRQGFLAPVTGHSSTLGMMAQVPYYFDLAPESDLIVAPTFSQEDKVQMALDWRRRFANGAMRWRGSVARTDFINENGYDRGYQWRGNVMGTAQFDLSDAWRAGTDINYTSDKSYLLRYKLGNSDILINRAYAERFVGRSYAVGNMYYFQDTRPGERLKEPFVAPEVRYSALGEPNETLGGRWSFGSGLLVVSRDKNVPATQQGPSTRRLSVETGWERQLVSSTGFLTTVAAQTRADGYWADNVPRPNETLGTSFTEAQRLRPFGQMDVTLRYPLGRRGEGYQQILEPITVLSVAPRMSQKTVLPNEDSLDVEFDETNLFSTNRFTGVDRLEGGTRVTYGARHMLIGEGGEKIDMLAGQVYRTNKDPNFPDSSGLGDKLSDYVGRIGFMPADWLTSSYSFRLDRNDGSLARQQFALAVGAPVFKPTLKYISARQIDASTDTEQRLEEGTIGFTSAFLKYWSLSGSHSHAFKPEPGPRRTLLELEYKDECFSASLTGERDNTERLDVDSGTTVMFRFNLKNVGGIEPAKISTGG